MESEDVVVNQAAAKSIFNTKVTGETYRVQLLEQYKLFCDSAMSVSQWRSSNNSHLLAVNTALLGTIGVLASKPGFQYAVAFLAILGVLVALAWSVQIRRYATLNSVKFEILHDLEKELAVPLFTYEWALLRNRGYQSLTQVEGYVPGVCGLLYLVLMFACR